MAMRYSDLVQELERLSIPFEEGAWRDAQDMQGDFGTYAIEAEANLYGDDGSAEHQWTVVITLEIYGDRGFAEAKTVEDAMDAAGVFWETISPSSYDPATGYTMWRWRASVIPDVMGGG